jgi:hypothetical protein
LVRTAVRRSERRAAVRRRRGHKGSASGGGKQIEKERETEKRQYFVSAVLDLDVAGARAVVRARRET